MSIPPEMLLDYVGNRSLFSEDCLFFQPQPRSHICSEGKQTANGAAGDIN